MAKTLAEPKTRTRRPHAPKQHDESKRTRLWLFVFAAMGLAAVATVGLLALASGGEDRAAAAGRLPDTSDYHSLLVAPADADRLTLGTHQGLFSSADGGRTWTQTNLAGQDAMNLSQPSGETVWAAGHNVLARSTDGGRSWEDVEPEGLPSLDVHGFAVDANDEGTLYAAIAGEGVYRSADAGASFSLVTAEVGRGVMALASLPDGRLLAGDMERQGLLASDDGGETWDGVVQGQIMGIAVKPDDPERILASGAGVLLSTDGGRSWKQTLSVPAGSGPIAWSPSEPEVAYVVGFDRSLHRTDDGGSSWTTVLAAEVG